jgi:hypothetical protein
MTILALAGRVGRAALIVLLWGICLALIPSRSLAAGTVTLVWDPSSGTNVIANYKIYYGTGSRTYTNGTSAGTATTLSVFNLVEGKTYYFAATAVDAYGLESDYSTEVSTVISVGATNHPPTLNLLVNLTINENAGLQTVNLSGITSGATNEVQTLTVTASSSNPSLIPTPAVNYISPARTGSITFTPVASTFGSATITVTVNDGGTSNNVVSRTFTVTVNEVNQAPTLNTLTDVTLNENAGLQTVNLSGISSGAANEVQTLAVTASSSNPSLIPTPAINYTSPNTTGSIAFTPVAFAYGSATITVTVNDGGASNNVVSRSFTVMVNPVNQAPTLNALANVTLNENASLQTVNLSGISSGAANEVQTLAVTASSSNPSLIPTPAINYTSLNTTGSIAFTPVAFAYGSATITVTVNDGGASNNVVSRSFTVMVNPVNQAPTLNALANVTLNENAGLQTVNLSGISSGAANEVQTLTVTTSSSNPSLIPTPAINYASPGTTGSISFTPVAYAFGSANVTVTVNDGGASNNLVSRSFTVTVNQINQPPIISAIANQATTQDTATPPLPFVVGDPDTAVSNLTVSASSSLPTLVPTNNIVFGGSGSNRTVTLTPMPGQSGYANITLTVRDGSLASSTTFRLTVTAGRIEPPPTEITLAPLAVVTPPDTYLCFLVGSSLVNKGQLTFSFDPGAPVNAEVNPTNGLFFWHVTRANAQTTNSFRVRIMDMNSRSRQVVQPMSVVVQGFLEVGLGAAAAQAGQNVSLPVTVDSSGGVTNLVFAVAWPAGRCTNATLAVIAPEIASGTLQTQGTNWVVRVQTLPGQAISGSAQIAQLSFQTVAGQRSAFVPLAISSMAATDASGMPYPNYIPRNGEVVVVGDVPLLRGAQPSGLSRTLTLYGKVGLKHELQYNTNGLSAASWRSAMSYLQTNAAQQVVVTSSSPVVFYRLVAH